LILEVADIDEALAWARKAVVACRAPVEVRSFFRSDPTGLLARTPLKEGMTQYLATTYLPDNFDPSAQDKEVESDFDALSEEMEASGVKEVFAGGLSPASGAKSLRAQPDGKVLITDGPYLETKEHTGGLSIGQAADIDEALTWTRKGAVVCRASGEVRPFFGRTPHRNSVYSLPQASKSPYSRRPHEKDQDHRTNLAGRRNAAVRR
jgi:hypothetical protein